MIKESKSFTEHLASDDVLDSALLAMDTDCVEAAEPSSDPHSTLANSRIGNHALERGTKRSSSEEVAEDQGKEDIEKQRLYTDDKIYEPTGFGEFGKYMHNKRKKLVVQNQALREEDAESGIIRAQIFKGLAIYVNGYTREVGLRQLTEMMVRHGAVYVPYLDRKSLVTHILATNLTPSKVIEFASYKIATPDWIVESVKAGRLLNWRDFSVQAAMDKRRIGDADEVAYRGGQTGQKGIFESLGKQKETESYGQRSKDSSIAQLKKGVSPQTATKPNVSLRESQQSSSKSPDMVVEEMSVDGIGDRQDVETMETLSERGRRLAEAAISLQNSPSKMSATKSSDFFQRKPSKEQAPSSAAALSIIPSPSKKDYASTDPITPTEETRSKWLPSRGANDRTMALLNDAEWVAKHTSASEDFLATYFQQSRLHHLSTWKEELKTLVAVLQPDEKRPVRIKKLTGMPSDGRIIMHVDFDSFFVSAGLTTRPDLKGKPVAVCHARGGTDSLRSTSEIASCSYETRSFGVTNGMSLGRARELCADITTIPFEFDLYKSIASKFYEILLSHADFLQAVSIDEVLMEVIAPSRSASANSQQDEVLLLAQRIRKEIMDATGCEASIGIGHNILLAKLATRKAKPASAYHLLPEDVADFLAPLDVDALPGIGWNLRSKLKSELGITKVGELLKETKVELDRVLGKTNGPKFLGYARGIDTRELNGEMARQSVSAEVNYGIRFTTNIEVDRFMRNLGVEVANRLKTQGVKARQMTLKTMKRHPSAPVDTPKFLGHGHCEVFNSSSPVAGPGNSATDDGTLLGEVAWKLIQRLEIPPEELRGIGIQMLKLEKGGRPADSALERGQPRLQFAAAGQTTSRTIPVEQSAEVVVLEDVDTVQLDSSDIDFIAIDSSPVATTLANQDASRAKKLEKDPSMIILSDSDPEDGVSPSKAIAVRQKDSPVAGDTKTMRTFVELPASSPYIPAMFRRSKRIKAAPKVLDEELAFLGIDSDVFRSMEPIWQIDALGQARVSKPMFRAAKKKQTQTKSKSEVKNAEMVKTKQPRLIGQVTKLNIDSKKPVTPIPDLPLKQVVSAPLPPSPTTMEDSEIVAMKLDPTILRELPMDEQRRIVKNRFIQRKAFTIAGIKPSVHSRHNARAVHFKPIAIRKSPRFQGKSDTEEIRTVIEKWVEEEADLGEAVRSREGPDDHDLEGLSKFLERCVHREKGHDLQKATAILSWWEYMIEAVFGREHDNLEGPARAWWEGYRRTRERVDYIVQRDYGLPLVIV